MASVELDLALKKLDALFKTRDSPEWWSQNIIDASRHLTDPTDWTKFYKYMADPDRFDENEPAPPMSHEEFLEAEQLLRSLPPELEEVRYENGQEVTIHLKNRRTTHSQDDEKVPA